MNERHPTFVLALAWLGTALSIVLQHAQAFISLASGVAALVASCYMIRYYRVRIRKLEQSKTETD